MKTKSLFTIMFITIAVFANGQNTNKNLLSGSLGIGTVNGKYGFMTALKYDRFISNRFSIGIGYNQISNHRFIGDKNTSFYFAENYYEKPTETDEDRTYSSIGANLNLNYYLLKNENGYLNISLGAISNLYQDRFIQYIGKTSSDSHISITSQTRWEKISFQSSMEYTRFINDYIGINFKIFYSLVGGEDSIRADWI